jgi:hypothetical protein
MAGADGGYSSFGVNGGTAHTYARVDASVSIIDDNTCSVTVSGYVYAQSGWELYQYGVHVQCGQNGSNEWVDTTDVFNGTAHVGNTSGTWNVSRGQNDRTISCWTKYWGEKVGGIGAAGISNSPAVYVDVTIPARPYHAHGNPSFSTPKTTVHYGETVELSWSKSETQGNANFDHFELWQGDTKLYSGSNTSYTVKPSDVTGAKGGTATYTLKEIHEWYGGYKTTEASVSIKVQSGVVTMYDSNGVKHVGLVTIYDAQGVKHYVLITAYDENGKAHNVV